MPRHFDQSALSELLSLGGGTDGDDALFASMAADTMADDSGGPQLEAMAGTSCNY